jgi:hypothetical protein
VCICIVIPAVVALVLLALNLRADRSIQGRRVCCGKYVYKIENLQAKCLAWIMGQQCFSSI